MAGAWSDAPRVERSERVDVRLLTWNVWFGSHMFDERRDALLADLQHRRPDVIALQEVTQELLDGLLAEPWLRAAYQASQRDVPAYDVVILSRLPIRRLAEVELPTDMGRGCSSPSSPAAWRSPPCTSRARARRPATAPRSFASSSRPSPSATTTSWSWAT